MTAESAETAETAETADEIAARYRAALRAAGAELAAINEARAAVLGRIAATCRESDGWVPIQQMARLTGISRPTIYKMLDG